MPLTEADIQPQMTRRRPGQSALTTPRDEKDRVMIQSGTEFGITLGTPIGMLVLNENQRPKDYGNSTMDLYPRPSHADFTYLEKYGVKASSGGGRSSARETIGISPFVQHCPFSRLLTSLPQGRVAAGAIAEKYLSLSHDVQIIAYVSSVGREHLFPPTAEHPSPSTNPAFLSLISTITRETVDSYIPVRCPDASSSARMAKVIEQHRDNHDSIGGTVTCVIRNCPIGLGEPCFDKLEAMLAHAMLSIPATKGFEIGSGFGGCEVPGSVHNDPFIFSPATEEEEEEEKTVQNGTPTPNSAPKPRQKQRLTTKTNNSGGIQGGISNGAAIYFRVAFKPPATIGQAQSTATYGFEAGVLEAKGRHDPCVVPRAVPIVEAMAALVLLDALMAQTAREGARALLPPMQGLTTPARGVENAAEKEKERERRLEGVDAEGVKRQASGEIE